LSASLGKAPRSGHLAGASHRASSGRGITLPTKATELNAPFCPHDELRRTARVALDIDAVLADLIGSCRITCADYLGVAPDELSATDEYLLPFVHADRSLSERLRPVIADFWMDSATILRAEAVPGGLDLAHRLVGEARLAGYVTRRPPSVDHLTRRWLSERGFPLAGIELHHVGDSNACKSITAYALGASVLIDDSVHEASSALANGMHVVMVAMPYNRMAATDLAARHGGRFHYVDSTAAALGAVTRAS
jgi:hypothetical protein